MICQHKRSLWAPRSRWKWRSSCSTNAQLSMRTIVWSLILCALFHCCQAVGQERMQVCWLKISLLTAAVLEHRLRCLSVVAEAASLIAVHMMPRHAYAEDLALWSPPSQYLGSLPKHWQSACKSAQALWIEARSMTLVTSISVWQPEGLWWRLPKLFFHSADPLANPDDARVHQAKTKSQRPARSGENAWCMPLFEPKLKDLHVELYGCLHDAYKTHTMILSAGQAIRLALYEGSGVSPASSISLQPLSYSPQVWLAASKNHSLMMQTTNSLHMACIPPGIDFNCCTAS